MNNIKTYKVALDLARIQYEETKEKIKTTETNIKIIRDEIKQLKNLIHSLSELLGEVDYTTSSKTQSTLK